MRATPGRAAQGLNWLCPTEEHRRRVIDMSPRVRRARLICSAAIFVGLLLLAPSIGWEGIALYAVAGVNLLTLDHRLEHNARPEVQVAISVVSTCILIALCAAVTGGPSSPVLPWMGVPVSMAAARFRFEVVVAGVVFGAVLALLAAFGTDAAGTLERPDLLVSTLVLLVCTVAITVAVTGAEMQHRAEAATDPLTGLPNRKAFELAAAGLARGSREGDEALAVVVCDLDHFKRVNDLHGHERGDQALVEAAHAMAGSLRSGQEVHRTGGEEFVVLLTGADLGTGALVAERMRAAVDAARPAGLRLTVSAGVAATQGRHIDAHAVLRRADRALYAAKDAGRNRVMVAERHLVPVGPA